MDDVRCTGSESRLIDCRYDSNSDCSHFEDASVRCVRKGRSPNCYRYCTIIISLYSQSAVMVMLDCWEAQCLMKEE